MQNRAVKNFKIFLANLSLKKKLLGAFLFLTVLNVTYFAFGLRSISEMNGIIINLYDRVVMSGTYALMVKGDFVRYTDAVNSIVLAETPEVRKAKFNEMNDAVGNFKDDLKVVQSRALVSDEATEVVRIDELFDKIKSEADSFLSQQGRQVKSADALLATSRAWEKNPQRLEVAQRLSDFTDRIIADGYTFRLNSVEKTELIKYLSIVSALVIFVMNALILALILISILPPLRKLGELCEEIVRGSFSKRVNVRSTDELGRLAKSFNGMLDILEQRDQALRYQLIVTGAMVNSLGQGFFMVDRNGRCLDVYSKACETILQIQPGGLELADVLRIPAEERGEFKDWLDIVFGGVLDFSDAAALGPAQFRHDDTEKSIAISYKASRDERGELQNLIVISTDRTAEKNATAMAEREAAFSKMITHLAKNQTQFRQFIANANRMIEEISEANLPQVRLLLHTIKGSAATFSFLGLKKRAHELEHQLLRSANPVSAAQLSQMKAELAEEMNHALEELHRTMAFKLNSHHDSVQIERPTLERFYFDLTDAGVDSVLRGRFVEEFLSVPIQSYFDIYSDAVQEVALQLGKHVSAVQFSGGDLRVDGQGYREVFASFVHLFRNAVDHGIELAEVRAMRGKPSLAKIEVLFSKGAPIGRDELRIEIRDDGGGIDPQKIRMKLSTLGVDTALESDADVIQRIFDEGFSTAAATTDISGRGVGLSAVRAEIAKMGGRIYVVSELGVGSAFQIKLPLCSAVAADSSLAKTSSKAS